MDAVVTTMRACGWTRIVVGGATTAMSLVRDAPQLNGTGSALLGLAIDAGFSGVGVLSGMWLLRAADDAAIRANLKGVALTLVLGGMLSFCDCGWVLSAPASLVCLVLVLKHSPEFS